jgi:RNA polymerase primary sigma factor
MLAEIETSQALSEEEKVEYLVDLGRDRQLPINLVIELFPNADENQSERVFQRLVDEKGIRITDQPRSEEKEPLYGPIDDVPTFDTVGLYLAEATKYPLLTFEEEQDLAKRMEKGKMAQQKFTSANGDVGKRQELTRLIEEGVLAKNVFIKSNLRLVISVARRKQGRGLPFLDLIQEGTLGLLRSLEDFDYHRGYKFSTYSMWWIRQAISRAISDNARTIRLPSYYYDRVGRLGKLMREFRQEHGREAKLEELADAMDLPQKKIARMLQDRQDLISLEEMSLFHDDKTRGELIEDRSSLDPQEEAARRQLHEKLEEALNDLSPQEAYVLRFRFGLSGKDPHLLKDIGKMFGLTRESIRQIEAKALNKLRYGPYGLRDFLSD